jgi:ribosomal protein S18 acetylase RimI-like enzyme
MEIIKSLNNTEFDSLYIAFKGAFKDYEIQWTKNELHTMLHRRGFVPELSFGAFEKDKLIAFTLNGIGLYKNVKTAYDTGTGTIKEYRGKGLATKIFEYSLPYLKKANIENYLLEVLQYNTKAISIYKNIGFKIEREFNYFVQKVENIKVKDRQLDSIYSIRLLDLSGYKTMNSFFDFIPSWQNSFVAINRKLEDFKILGAFKENELVGHCILEPKSGDITQIAVNKLHRRKGIASLLFKEILNYNKHHSIKIINTQTDCHSIIEFLKSKDISITGKLFEMIKEIQNTGGNKKYSASRGS